MKKAIIFGASGFVGSFLVQELLNINDYSEVIAVVRKPLNIANHKLRMVFADLNTLSNHREDLVGNDVFITIGTTKKRTPNSAEYYKADHDYPVEAAKVAKEGGATNVVLLTAIASNPNSSIFYIKTKGETERDVIALNYQHTHIFQPSVILGNRIENRPLEKILIAVWKNLNFALPGMLRSYRGIYANELAKAMANAVKQPLTKVKRYQWDEIKALL